jgi:hypothetical protein
MKTVTHAAVITSLLGLFGCEQARVNVGIELIAGPKYEQIVLRSPVLTLYSESTDAYPIDTGDIELSIARSVQELYTLDEFSIPAAEYSSISLDFAQDGQVYDLDSFEAPLQSEDANVVSDISFSALSDQDHDVILRLDLHLSIIDQVSSTGRYLLKPHLRWVDLSEVAYLAGTVEASVVPITCGDGAMVYLFSGSDSIAHDEWTGTLSSPEATAILDWLETQEHWIFDFGPLRPGSYSLAYTCSGLDDEPDRYDGLQFETLNSVELNAGDDRTLRFLGNS